MKELNNTHKTENGLSEGGRHLPPFAENATNYCLCLRNRYSCPASLNFGCPHIKERVPFQYQNQMKSHGLALDCSASEKQGENHHHYLQQF